MTYGGGLPGLYGGTRNYAACDAEKLVRFLEQSPNKAAAWAATLGIQTTQIREYVSELTPVILRTDTRVTNHGFVNGRANPIQAVLEAGTAVFIDKYGQPVIKCYCGNPLTPAVAYATPTYIGTLWVGFAPAHITIINQSTTIINTFTLYDPNTGLTFTRRAGTSGSHDGPYLKPSESPPTAPSSSQSPVQTTPTQPASPTTPAQPAPPATPTKPAPTSTHTEPETTIPSRSQAENPAASFSPNPGTQGESFTLSASGFNPGAQLQITLTRPDGVLEHYSFSVGSDGTASYVFSDTANVITGTYSATVTNPATGARAQSSVEVQPSAHG